MRAKNLCEQGITANPPVLSLANRSRNAEKTLPLMQEPRAVAILGMDTILACKRCEDCENWRSTFPFFQGMKQNEPTLAMIFDSNPNR